MAPYFTWQRETRLNISTPVYLLYTSSSNAFIYLSSNLFRMMPDSEPIVLKDQEVHETLKYSLLGPSLLKSGQQEVDQRKVKYCARALSQCP